MKRIPIFLTALLLTLTAGCSEQIIDKTPIVHLLISGTVLDSQTGAPIEGLKVTLTDRINNIYIEDRTPACPPVLTDGTGTYRFDSTGTPLTDFYLFIDDIDGPEHGGDYGSNNIYADWIDYRQASLQETSDHWDYGSIEKKVETLCLNIANSLPWRP